MLFLNAWVLTVAIETAVLLLVVRLLFRIERPEMSNGLLVFAGVFCSTTTLPYLWFVLPVFLEPFAARAILGESLVVLVETVFYLFVLRMGVRRCLFASLLCNLTSVAAGVMIM